MRSFAACDPISARRRIPPTPLDEFLLARARFVRHLTKMPSKDRVRRIRDRLRELYGRPVAPPHGHGLDELILTVLSQSTNDRNRDVAFLRLRDRFPSWEAVRDAPNEEVEAAIRPGGISKVKSVRIQEILRAIGDPLTLDHLAAKTVEQG